MKRLLKWMLTGVGVIIVAIAIVYIAKNWEAILAAIRWDSVIAWIKGAIAWIGNALSDLWWHIKNW